MNVKLWLKPITKNGVPVGARVYAVGVASFNALTEDVLQIYGVEHATHVDLHGVALLRLVENEPLPTVVKALRGHNVRIKVSRAWMQSSVRTEVQQLKDGLGTVPLTELLRSYLMDRLKVPDVRRQTGVLVSTEDRELGQQILDSMNKEEEAAGGAGTAAGSEGRQSNEELIAGSEDVTGS